MQFYLFPFFFRSIYKRFSSQFAINKSGELCYLPEHKNKIYHITNTDCKSYLLNFKKRLFIESILGLIVSIVTIYWIFFVQVSYGFFFWGILVLSLFYHDSYSSVISSFYNPGSFKIKVRILTALIPIVLSFIGLANYFGWILTRDDLNLSFDKIFSKLGLTSFIEKYPYPTIGLIIALVFFLRMQGGVMMSWFRPASKKKSLEILEERKGELEQEDWKAYEKELDAKLNPKKNKKKKRKKELKKQGKVLLKKYKGETTNE